jgi:hypothetical protein
VNGTCDLQFKLWDAASGGNQVGWTWLSEGVEIVDGLFTARLDFGGMDVHNGSARWLEVAVRCPAGSGGYVTLDPRQELTGAPAALSLALPFLAEANLGGPLLWIENSGIGEAAGFESVGGIALWVEAPASEGVHVATAGQDGVHVVSAGGRGVAVETAGGDGVFVNTAHGSGVHVNSADYSGFQVDTAGQNGVFVNSAVDNGLAVDWAGLDGIFVGSAADKGVHVGSAGGDGVYVGQAGSPSTIEPNSSCNGFEVAGAEGNGLYVGRADVHGVYVGSAAYNGVYVAEAGDAGVSVSSAGWDGMYVGLAGWDGFHVEQATYDGVEVVSAGNPSDWPISPSNNGFEVRGAEGYGLYVGRADLDGVYVNSTAWHGLNVAGAGVNGVYVTGAGNNGVEAAGNNYAGYFHGDIYVTGNCIGCALAVFSLNAGDQPLEPGQIVAIQGVEATTLDNTPALWRVVPAEEGTAAVGVVRGKAELDEAPEGATLREGETGRRLVPRSGVAQPGDYLTLVIYGPMQVRVSAADGAIEPGTRLAVGKLGAARALKTVVVEGLTLAESAPTIGIALTAPDEDGLVWVLVNPQ